VTTSQLPRWSAISTGSDAELITDQVCRNRSNPRMKRL
jgi:hypothetical protein